MKRRRPSRAVILPRSVHHDRPNVGSSTRATPKWLKRLARAAIVCDEAAAAGRALAAGLFCFFDALESASWNRTASATVTPLPVERIVTLLLVPLSRLNVPSSFHPLPFCW